MERDIERYKALLLEEYVGANEFEKANELLERMLCDKKMMSQPYYKCWTYILACRCEKKQENYKTNKLKL
jgi:hypothetical protein